VHQTFPLRNLLFTGNKRANVPANCDADNANITPLLRKLWRFLVAVKVKFRTYWIRLGVQLHISAAWCCRESSASTGRDSEEEKSCTSRLAHPGRSAASHVNDWTTAPRWQRCWRNLNIVMSSSIIIRNMQVLLIPLTVNILRNKYYVSGKL
jgi:hypothetical protein